MRQTWRWFGPSDLVSIEGMLQAGVEGVVSALHNIPAGEIWSAEEIAKRQAEIETWADGKQSGLRWEVTESLPVSEDIKRQCGNWRSHLENYRTSLKNLADAGVDVVCYNFMPVLDWTRTHLAWQVAHGGNCMRFDYADFAAFDIHMLKRPGAADSYDKQIVQEAEQRFAKWDKQRCNELAQGVLCGLPGGSGRMSIEDVLAHLDSYSAIDEQKFRSNFAAFLEEVVPTANELGLRMCCHPDDPPFSLLGLPRIMSTEADYEWLIGAVDLPANGITLCSGSLGVNPANDLPGMMERLGKRVHFLHLRNVTCEADSIPCSFYEDEHLCGNTDMIALLANVLREEALRKQQGREDCSIPMRPDHGQQILGDIGSGSQPGYPAVGRLKGLAELRGAITALTHPSLGISSA